MKICILTTAFPRWEDDPRAPFVLEAAYAIRRLGHSVRVVAMHNPGAKTHEHWDGVEIFRPRYLPEKWEILQKDTGGLPVAWKTNPWAKFAIIPFIFIHTLNAIRIGRDCDIIHANWTLSGLVAWISGMIIHKPYVVTVQGSDVFKAPKNIIVRFFTQNSLKNAKQIIALSHALAEGVIALGAPRDRVVVIPNGVNIQHFPYNKHDNNRKERILFVGSLIERKAPDILLRAFREVANRFPTMDCVIIGEGAQRQELENEVARLGLHSRVIFTGLQTQAQVSRWMQSARAFILPSLEEGQGVVLVEALASGTPVIGTQVGGIPDVITPDVGILIPPNDVGALADGIVKIVEDQERWREFSRCARMRAETVFDWNEIARQIVEVYLSRSFTPQPN